jgi:hypothetical protein
LRTATLSQVDMRGSLHHSLRYRDNRLLPSVRYASAQLKYTEGNLLVFSGRP